MRKCPDSAPYIDYRNKDIPECVSTCATDFFIDDITTPGVKICVRSCKNLNPTAYVYEDSDITATNKNRCVRTCPANKPYIDPSD